MRTHTSGSMDKGDMPNLPMHHADIRGQNLQTAGMVDERTNKKVFMMPAARTYIHNNINN